MRLLRSNRFLAALVVLNLALLGSLAGSFLATPEAHAQAAGGDYLLLPGNAVGVPADVVYVIDSRNGAMIGVAFDTNTGQLTSMPGVDLNRVFQAAGN